MNEGMTGYLKPGAKRQRREFNNANDITRRLGPNQSIGFGDIVDKPVLPLAFDKTGVLPSATIATFGTALLLTPDSGFTTFLLSQLALIFASVGSETLTVSLIPNYDDGTSGSAVLPTATTSSTLNLTAKQIASLHKSGVGLVSITITIKSSIGSSTATLEVTGVGLEMGQLA